MHTDTYMYIYTKTIVFESDAFDVLLPVTGINPDPTDRRCTTTGWYKISAATKAAEVEVESDEEEKSCFDGGHDMSWWGFARQF